MRTGAYATAPNLEPSSVVSAACTIQLPATSARASRKPRDLVQRNGSPDLDDIRLQLTNG